ncbi:hypothetical protein [Butyrivibrio sp. AE3004]|uniref:hypothetical protein n=1 Tax=Butyrivibrio sp. AE3004 TaxID=1506994 RepID=UPI0009DEF7D9|nr:hypothetical protein [Butyrivibrio sp. AE3004]
MILDYVSDCKHDTEPGCAVKAALESGELSLERYNLYKSLSNENTKNYARKKYQNGQRLQRR